MFRVESKILFVYGTFVDSVGAGMVNDFAEITKNAKLIQTEDQFGKVIKHTTKGFHL